MEEYARGACIGDYVDDNPTGFKKLVEALEFGPNSKRGCDAVLQKIAVQDCGGVSNADSDGATVLHWACRYKHTKPFIQWLLKKGADVDGLTKEQLMRKEKFYRNASDVFEAKSICFNDGVPSPLHEVSRFDFSHIAEILLNPILADAPEDKNTELHDATDCKKDDESLCAKNEKAGVLDRFSAVVRSTLSASVSKIKGADPNLRDKEGNTPLHVCAVWNNVNTAKVLLAYGADPTLRNSYGLTPFDWADDSFKEMKALLADATSRA